MPPLCKLGEQFPRELLRTEFERFAESGIYANRPVRATNRFNVGGTGFFHAFYLWFVVRQLQPLHVIESGAFEGLGTWIIRQAAPSAQIFVLTPAMPKLYVDRRASTRYFTGRHFLDFSKVDWECVGLNKARTLVFFDDHQSGYRRTLEAFARGFSHLMFDDNYPWIGGGDGGNYPYLPRAAGGDNFSPKAACAALEISARHRSSPAGKTDIHWIGAEEAVSMDIGFAGWRANRKKL